MSDSSPARSKPAAGKPPGLPKGFAKKRRHARDKGMQALYQWQISAEDLDFIRDHYLEEQGIAAGDPDYFVELLYKIPSQVSELDKTYNAFVSAKFADRLDPIETSILRIATYELLHRIEIPAQVVINEAVNLAHSYGTDDSHRFVNGVLDPLARSIRKLEFNAQ